MNISGDSGMENHVVKDMQIPVNAEVSCKDGACGKSTYVLINPITEKVTHLVVKGAASPHNEYMVPVGVVAEATTELIQLRCSREELEHMDLFIKTEFIKAEMPDTYSIGYGMGTYMFWPYAVPEHEVTISAEHQQIPLGELALRRGSDVEATDGKVGHVDEFLINPDTGNITHLVMREGHLWGQKDVSIPVSDIRETRGNTVFLKLDKLQVEALPTIPVHRKGA
jgi:sporulation protein YlmC with PRC-barrel domain